ncbi:MAG: MMPL family transporter [Myxococcales bacterium]|jgi:predicted RND superfamily exporter protein|nr:MMPL family transporter [Myxococcales bacterium]
MAEPSWMSKVEAFVGRTAALSFRNAFYALAIAALLSLMGFWLSTRLTLNADMTSLLPETFESVRDLGELREKFGGMGYVVVVGEGAAPDVLRRFADEMAPKLEALDGIRFVEFRRATDFFEDRALYYLSTDDLTEVARRIKERERYERRMKNPMFVRLDEETPPSLDFEDITERYAGGSRDRLAADGERYYLDAEERIVALLAKPAGTSVDLDYAKQIVGRVETLLQAQDLSAYPGLTTSLTGTYKKKIDQQAQITADVAWASSIAMLLMLLFLAFHFRSIVAVLLVLAPTTAGLLWAYGFAALAYGQVNLLTAFLGAILGGLGTEHGIHLFGRYASLRRSGSSGEEAIREAFTHTGGAALISSLVAALTFSSLSLSDFSAFREFGAIAAIGMIAIVWAYVLLFPAILGLLTRFGFEPKAKEAVVGTRSWMFQLLPQSPKAFAIAGAIVLAALMLRLPATRFDFDLGTLEDSSLPSFQLDRKVNKLLGYSQTPVVIFTKSSTEERALVEELNARKTQRREASTIDFAAALDDLVPPEQTAKRATLDEIEKRLRKVKRDSLEESARDGFDRLVRMTAVHPFTRDDIPESIKRQFEGVAGDGGFVLAFPGISLSDGARVIELSREVRDLSLPDGGRISAVGEALILADIIDMVTREALPVLCAAILFVLAALWITLGSLKLALVCLSPTLVSILALVGLMGFAGIDFNFLNIVAIPVLIGTTIDAGVHLISRLGSTKQGESFGTIYAETGRAICGGLITSAVGFGAMILADHPGLASLGKLTILGFCLNLAVMLFVFPAFLMMRRKKSGETLSS